MKRYGDQKTLSACEILFSLSSEAVSEILNVRRWNRSSRVVLAVVLQRQLLGALVKGLSISGELVLISLRDKMIRIESSFDHDRIRALARKIGMIARTSFDLGKMKAFERTLTNRLGPMSTRYLEKSKALNRVIRDRHIRLPAGVHRDGEWAVSLARDQLHKLNNSLFLRTTDEALVAEVVLLSFGHSPANPN